MMNVPPVWILISLEGMLHFACNEWIGILLKDAQAGAGAEVDPLAAMDGTGKSCRIFQFAATDGLVFR